MKIILILIMQLAPIRLNIDGVDMGVLGSANIDYSNRVLNVRMDFIFGGGFE